MPNIFIIIKTMNKYIITFIRENKVITTIIEAFNEERAILRFGVNFGNEIPIINIKTI